MSNNRWKLRKSLPVGMLDMNGTAEIDYRLQEHFDDEYVHGFGSFTYKYLASSGV